MDGNMSLLIESSVSQLEAASAYISARIRMVTAQKKAESMLKQRTILDWERMTRAFQQGYWRLKRKTVELEGRLELGRRLWKEQREEIKKLKAQVKTLDRKNTLLCWELEKEKLEKEKWHSIYRATRPIMFGLQYGMDLGGLRRLLEISAPSLDNKPPCVKE